MRRRGVIALAAALLTGCAHSSVVLLPDEDGGQGQLAILQPGEPGAETLVAAANSRATLGKRPSIRPLGSGGLKPDELALLASLPPPPKRFSLYFLQGTTNLTPTSMPLVDEIRAEVAKRPGAEVQVTGHTDTTGSDADNDLLSRNRAEEILTLLAARGFDRSMMRAVGRGEREPKIPTGDNVSSPVNRRVEVIVR